MNNIIDFNEHIKNKKKKKIKKNKILKRPTSEEAKYNYKFLADYENEELYINVTFKDFDINVDVGVNLKIIDQLIKMNPLTQLTTEYLDTILDLEPQYIQAIHATYEEFGFIDSETKMLRSINDIANSYINKRLKLGYPKSKKKFDTVLSLEKKVFSEHIKDTSIFNDELYWKAENKY